MYSQRPQPPPGHSHSSYLNPILVGPPLDSSRRNPYKPRGPPTPPYDMASSALYSLPHSAPHHRYDEELGPYRGHYSDITMPVSYPATRAGQRQDRRPSQTTASRQSSPSASHKSYTSNATSHSRMGSSHGHIAPALQIPKTINASGGSLSELAAEITCLFWFEDSVVLDLALDPSCPLPSQPLHLETNPSTGFRKWVTTMLSTTQVAQNVILLGLLFIYRLKRQNPTVRGKIGSEYRLLTVALMLGNKFLDDNTYTNKTWADVSGISVSEIHIMEVEFLSNMKYDLFTSAAEWIDWHIQLGKFARFQERAESAMLPQLPLPIPYGSTVLPSPPSSYQNSPPRSITPGLAMQFFPSQLPQPSLPASARPSPLHPVVITQQRKRTLEDEEFGPAKRQMQSSAQINSGHYPPQPSAARPMETSFPHLPYPTPSAQPVAMYTQRDGAPLHPQLPSISQLPNATPAWQSGARPHPSSMAAALQSAHSSRHQSPFPSSNNVSPTNLSVAGFGQSPSFYLAQRGSPYRPVRNVHTLLVPPPRTLHRPEDVGNSQMHYQPLGRPLNEIQQGRLPYIAQNLYFDGLQKRMSEQTRQWTNTIPPPRVN